MFMRFPARSSYVGGDVTADVIASGMSDRKEISLLIDVGTNGELVLGSESFLASCSCSAGPAFEGGEVEFGTRAMYGAIERIWIDDAKVHYSTIGNVQPKGICGSGLIELVAELFSNGIIDRVGKIQLDKNNIRIQTGSSGNQFVVAFKDETAINKDIVITDVDIQNILRTKAAVYASSNVLLKTFGYKFTDLTRRIYCRQFRQLPRYQKSRNDRAAARSSPRYLQIHRQWRSRRGENGTTIEEHAK